jgi:hypothetical protein
MWVGAGNCWRRQTVAAMVGIGTGHTV